MKYPKNMNSLPATFEPINCRLFKNQFSNYIMTEDVNVLALKLSQKLRQKMKIFQTKFLRNMEIIAFLNALLPWSLTCTNSP